MFNIFNSSFDCLFFIIIAGFFNCNIGYPVAGEPGQCWQPGKSKVSDTQPPTMPERHWREGQTRTFKLIAYISHCGCPKKSMFKNEKFVISCQQFFNGLSIHSQIIKIKQASRIILTLTWESATISSPRRHEVLELGKVAWGVVWRHIIRWKIYNRCNKQRAAANDPWRTVATTRVTEVGVNDESIIKVGTPGEVGFVGTASYI